MKNFTFKTLALVLLSSFATLSNATNYYASPTGTGTGTIGDPCSLTSGVAKATTPGDTLFLRGGQYDLTTKVDFKSYSGNSSARIAYFAYPGETVVIDFRGQVYGSRGFQVDKDYLHFKGLRIQYSGDNGMHITSNNNIIEECTFYRNCDTGLQISGSSTGGVGNLIKNCDSYENFDYQTGTLAAADFGGNADGFADKLFDNTNDTNIYEGCRAWNNADDGWDMYNRKGITHYKNCWCYANGPASYDMTNHARYSTDQTWFDQFPATVTKKGTTNTYNVTLANYTNFGNGNGFKLGGDFRNNTVTMQNCLSANNTVRGFDQNNNAGAMTLYNCTSYNNGVNYGFGDKVSSSSASHPTAEVPATNATLDIKNSVSLATKSADTWPSSTYLTTSNNTWSGSVTCTSADFISIDPSVMTSARQADGSLPNIVFMQLATGSDLIDAGTNVSLAYSGAAPDMGCFELGNLDQFPGAVSTPSNKDQSLTEGGSITNIVFTWSAGATGLTVTGLPTGINTNTNSTNKTLTLSGSPTEIGVFNYTVTTEGGTGTPATVNGKIIIKSTSAKKIAYVTDLTATNDTRIYPALSENIDFNVTKIDGTQSSIDFSGYDMVVLSELINSSSAGITAVKAELANKPILMMKVFAYPKTTWNWGGTASDWKTTPSTTAIVVDPANQSNPIFTGLSFTGASSNELEMVTQTGPNNKGVNSINPTLGTAWSISGGSITILGTIKGQTANDICVMEIPVGTTVSGSTIAHKFVQIGISGETYAYASDNALKLIANTCYYAMGMSIPTSNKQTARIDFSIKQTMNEIKVISDASIIGLSLYSISGNKLTESQSETINISKINSGIYILEVSTETGKAFKKIIIQ